MNPRKKDTKLYDIEIDMILNRYRGRLNLRLRKRDIARDPSLGRVLIKNALLISRNRSEKR